MKLESVRDSTSFYESFSDLVFATMAIFVLLMLVFLVQANQAGESASRADELAQELSRQADEVTRRDEELRKARDARDEAEEQLRRSSEQVASLEKAVRAKAVEIVIAVDATGSMGPALARLKDTIATIARVLPQIAPDVRVGVVAYRQKQGERRETTVFSSRAIEPFAGDRPSSSYLDIERFVDGLAAENGRAPVRTAIAAALSMFRNGVGDDVSQTFMLIGDVGPWESSLQDADLASISAAERGDERAIVESVRGWAKGAPHRSVVTVFQRDETRDPTPTQSDTIQFLRRVAEAAGASGRFGQDHRHMLAYLLEAILSRD